MKSRALMCTIGIALFAAGAIVVQLLAQEDPTMQEPELPTFTILHTFTGMDGAAPYGSLVRDSEGNLYGTTTRGGPYGSGTVFELYTTGKERVLYNFTGGLDGEYPYAGAIRDAAGNLYGTTVYDGFSFGTVFKLDTTGKLKTLDRFTGNAPNYEAWPFGGVIRDATGNLYGTTNGGVQLFADGTVFKLDTAGKERVLYGFVRMNDGGGPKASLIRDAAGNFYGTTRGGGATSCQGGCGTVFKVNAVGHETLYTFLGPDGAHPWAPLIRDAAANLYGTTSEGGDLFRCGGAGCGVVYKLDSTFTETVLYTFLGGTDGAAPYGGLVRDAAGNLYGTTVNGGSSNCNQGCGTVFKLDPNGNETVLYRFTGRTDGSGPYGGLIRDSAGNLYGTTSAGGDRSCKCGVVFKLKP